MQRKYWDDYFAGRALPRTDEVDERWLASYPSIYPQNEHLTALDVGCGIGLDSSFLSRLGYDVTSLDFSQQALAYGQKQGYIDRGVVADVAQLHRLIVPLSMDVVVASLSLHYVEHDKLTDILKSIFACLKEGGRFYARFNRWDDWNYGADLADSQGYYYSKEGALKVFYREEKLQALLAQFGGVSLVADKVLNYGKPKSVIRVCVTKS